MSQSDVNQDKEFEVCAKGTEPFGQYATSNIEPTFVSTNSSDNNFSLTGVSSYDHLSDKIYANIGSQSALVSDYDGLVLTGTSATVAQLGNAVDLIGNNIESVNSLATTSGLLGKSPTYDLVGSPTVATLNIATDNLSTAQGYTHSAFAKLENDSLIVSSLALHSNRITTLNDAALNTAIFDIPVSPAIDERVEKVEKKMLEINEKLTEIKIQKRETDINDTEEEIAALLNGLEKRLGEKFRGAIQVINQKNDDYIAQSAASLSGVLEKMLPSLGIDEQQGNKQACIKKGLAKYLGVPENHYLVQQQPAFFDTLGGIRHDNPEVYKLYSEDESRYKALVLQIEGYIYTLLTYKDVS